VTNPQWDYACSFNCSLRLLSQKFASRDCRLVHVPFIFDREICFLHVKYLSAFLWGRRTFVESNSNNRDGDSILRRGEKTIEMSAEKRGCQLHPRRLACSFLGKRLLLSAIVAHSAGPLTLLFSSRRVKIRSLHVSWNNKQTETGSLALVNYRAR
jgi:hypothetical protein